MEGLEAASEAPAGAASEGDEPAIVEAPVEIGSVAITVDESVAGVAAVNIDLVLVYDAGQIATIESLGARTWFAERTERAATAGVSLYIKSWSLRPGTSDPETPLEAPPGALAGFVFADLPGEGDHRARIEGAGTLAIAVESGALTAELLQ